MGAVHRMQVYSKATDKLVAKSVPYKRGGWVFVRGILDNEAIDLVQVGVLSDSHWHAADHNSGSSSKI